MSDDARNVADWTSDICRSGTVLNSSRVASARSSRRSSRSAIAPPLKTSARDGSIRRVLRQSASWWRGAVPKKTALRQYLDTFFGGSLARMMTALDAESSFSDDEVEALTAEIERLRKERKRS